MTYQYDSLQRLTSASAQQWTQTYSYDGFGNLFQKGGTGLAASYSADWSSQLNSSKNQVGSHSTDGALIYSHGIWLYDYAHDKKRVTRAELNGRRFVDFYSGNQRIGTYELVQRNDNGNITFETVTRRTESYLGGKRVASEDRLGSATDVRLAPYGEELGTPTANDRVKFATYYRDDTGMDYADQRYYRPGYGRFASVDPYDGSAKAGQPSSWNRYAYVEGDPANANDPTGLDPYTFVNISGSASSSSNYTSVTVTGTVDLLDPLAAAVRSSLQSGINIGFQIQYIGGDPILADLAIQAQRSWVEHCAKEKIKAAEEAYKNFIESQNRNVLPGFGRAAGSGCFVGSIGAGIVVPPDWGGPFGPVTGCVLGATFGATEFVLYNGFWDQVARFNYLFNTYIPAIKNAEADCEREWARITGMYNAR